MSAWDFAAIDTYHDAETNGRDGIEGLAYAWWDDSEWDGDTDPNERFRPNQYNEAVVNNQTAESSPVRFSSPLQEAHDNTQQGAPPTLPSIRDAIHAASPLQSANASPESLRQRAERAALTQQSSQAHGTNTIRDSHQNPPVEPAPSRHSRPTDSDSDTSSSSSLHAFSSTVPSTIRMPAAQRTRNSVVDLTDSPANTTGRAATRKRPAENTALAPGTSKRKKRGTVSPPKEPSSEDEEAPSAESELLKAQQLSALKAQTERKEEAPQKIGQRTCIICLENYTNATTAICGHIFCHECLTRALIASEKHSNIGQCPACRKPLSRKKKETIIPIAFMKQSAFAKKGRPVGFKG